MSQLKAIDWGDDELDKLWFVALDNPWTVDVMEAIRDPGVTPQMDWVGLLVIAFVGFLDGAALVGFCVGAGLVGFRVGLFPGLRVILFDGKDVILFEGFAVIFLDGLAVTFLVGFLVGFFEIFFVG